MKQTVKSNENIIGTLPMGMLIRKMSGPVILSMLVSSLYSIIDSVFVSRLGTNALTAMSLATPMSSLLANITVGFTVGMNAVLSKYLGEKKTEEANRTAGCGILINLFVAAAFALFGFFFTGYYYRMQTDITEIQILGTQYTSIVCIFSFGVACQVMFERILVAAGKPIGSVWSLVTGTLLNLILDPIMIFGYFGFPELGMKGAAIATVIAQFTAAGVALCFNIRQNTEISFSLKMLKPDMSIVRRIFGAGAPAALQQSISPFMIFFMNQILLTFTPAAPAVYVIFVRLQSFVLIPIWGFKNTVISIIAYNYGAAQEERIKAAMRICLIATECITLAGLIVFHVFPEQLLSIFNAGGYTLEIGKTALRIMSITFPFAGTTLILGAFLQALGHSGRTLATSLVQMSVLLTGAIILSRIGTVYTVWTAFIAGEIAALAIDIIFMMTVVKPTLQKISDGHTDISAECSQKKLKQKYLKMEVKNGI
jgi:putative MATE family efflux protein